MASNVGYSGTPLAKKLGMKSGSCVYAVNAPENYRKLCAPLPEGLVFQEKADKKTDIVHLFVDERAELAKQLLRLPKKLRSDATLWISWPKKAAKVPTDVSEDVIRELALPLGLVDVKVCAVSDVWSALKLVVRKELR